jgi:hypothetical protein
VPRVQRFRGSVQGIRGPYWAGREESGRRRSYRVGGKYRDGAVTVSRSFFPDLHGSCARWLDHVAEQDDPCGHAQALPEWLADCWEEIRRVERGDDAAARVAAGVLGVDVRSVYRGLAEST